jgi:hypothetical protein
VRACCEDVDRDPATLETSTLITVVVDEHATADQLPQAFRSRAAVGTPPRSPSRSGPRCSTSASTA